MSSTVFTSAITDSKSCLCVIILPVPTPATLFTYKLVPY